MSTRKVLERIDAQHETPPPAVCGRLHVAVPKSDQLPPAGGGSLTPTDICCLITTEYAEQALSGDFRDAAREIAGVEPPGLH